MMGDSQVDDEAVGGRLASGRGTEEDDDGYQPVEEELIRVERLACENRSSEANNDDPEEVRIEVRESQGLTPELSEDRGGGSE